jgi:hypothetical protein
MMVEPYLGDDSADERWRGWSYLGDRYVCPLADDDRTCHRQANALYDSQDETELRGLAAVGHRCAFVRLMQLLVEQDRVDDLRQMALQGDGRAEVTLLEYLHHHGDRDGLRREARGLPRANLYLAELLADQGDLKDALAVLARAESDADPEHTHAVRSLALRLGRRAT